MRRGGPDGRHRRPHHRLGADRARLRPRFRRRSPRHAVAPDYRPQPAPGLVADPARPRCSHGGHPRRCPRGPRVQRPRRSPPTGRRGGSPTTRLRGPGQPGRRRGRGRARPDRRMGRRHRQRMHGPTDRGRRGGGHLRRRAGHLGHHRPTWVRNGRLVHHIVDPWTGRAPPIRSGRWCRRPAPTCVEANAWSTAAVVWGEDALGNLDDHGVSARLVDADGDVDHRRMAGSTRPVETGRSTDARSDLVDDALVHHPGHRRGGSGPAHRRPWSSACSPPAGPKSRTWPAFAQADLHKRVSLLAMVFLAFHVLTAVLDTYVNVGWAPLVVPFVSAYSALVDRSRHGGRRPHGRGGRLERPAPADQRPDLAGHPLAGLRQLAGGHGPRPRRWAPTPRPCGWTPSPACARCAVLGALAWRVRDHRRSRGAGPPGRRHHQGRSPGPPSPSPSGVRRPPRPACSEGTV